MSKCVIFGDPTGGGGGGGAGSNDLFQQLGGLAGQFLGTRGGNAGMSIKGYLSECSYRSKSRQKKMLLFNDGEFAFYAYPLFSILFWTLVLPPIFP